MWEDKLRERTHGPRIEHVRSKPAIPDTGWQRPDLNNMNLAGAKLISIDTETCDPTLNELGPGAKRGGYIAGLAVGTDDGRRWYLPFAHQYDPNNHNMPREHVLRWARDNLTRPGQPKVGARLLYDLEFLAEAGVPVEGPFYDVQVAEPLIDEEAHTYALDALGEKYLGEGKRDEVLYQWCSAAYGGSATRKAQAQNIYRAPPEVVGPYAEADVDLPLRVLAEQQKVLQAQGLNDIWDIETQLIPMLLAMRRRGVRVNVSGAKELDHNLMLEAERARQALQAEGIDPNVRDGIAAYCDRRGIKYNRTAPSKAHPDGLPSFTAPWFNVQDDEILGKVALVRKLEKHAGTFLQGYIVDHQIGGRLYCEFNQLRSDEYGTVSGRFSSSNPNLQNIPSRDEELAPLVRSLWLPEEDEDWYSDDWSQIEYRLLVHYGRGKGARETQQQYIDNPRTDFHVYVSELTGVPRKPAKNINFGLVYGMGESTLAARLGRTTEQAKEIFDQYHGRLPFVKKTYDEAQRIARDRGDIRTILGRRRRFRYYEPSDWNVSRAWRAAGKPALSREVAEAEWGVDNIRRAYTHKALNSLLQGSAADIMKKAMVDIWKAGVCNYLGAPLLTVHDELDWSVPRTPAARQAHDEVVRIMESCVRLNVPLLCDSESGPNWGQCK